MKRMMSCFFGLLIAVCLGVCSYGQDDYDSALEKYIQAAIEKSATSTDDDKLTKQIDEGIVQALVAALEYNTEEQKVTTEPQKIAEKVAEVREAIISKVIALEGNKNGFFTIDYGCRQCDAKFRWKIEVWNHQLLHKGHVCYRLPDSVAGF